MAFKFAILLISFVIVNNSASPPTNEEVISDAYKFAYYYYYNNEATGFDSNENLSKSAFLDFVGKEDNFEYVNSYWSENSVSSEAQNHIYLEDFRELVASICTIQNIDIKVFLEKRIAAAKLITYAFDIATGYYDLGPMRNNMILLQSDFLDFVGKEDNVEFLNSYWTANSISPEAQDYILFKVFRRLIYWICSQREFVIKDFLEERIPVAEVT
ncbi:uncharacterized protein LOC126841289 [Adelges cooleyi]|uniref:uncharacterized protein LOC126841289 n=1 Tax=Adelges cooleyi TaxID=133065 RepID=UPI00217FD428|nr:uncharacterized protein LOC126841289 [Adelges cooleyi]